MKGVSGIIGGVVVIILILLVVSLALVAMNYAYGVQQIEAKTIMSQLSQPHVAQVSPDSVMTSGRLVASYIIYPDGRIAFLNMTVSGIKGFQSYLDGNPWAVVVFSNGQWVNVTNANIGSTGFGVLGTGSYLVPYYPGHIDPNNYTQLVSVIYSGVRYNFPLYSHVNATFLLSAPYDIISPLHNYIKGSYKFVNATVNPSDPLVFTSGRILEVPVTTEDGWLNFTAVDLSYGLEGSISFAVLIPNATNTIVALHVGYYVYEGQPNVTYYGPVYNNTVILQSQYYGNLSYGIYQFIDSGRPSNSPPIYIPISSVYVLNPNISFTLYNSTAPVTSVIKVALKFSQGQPVQMYLWAGYYNGSGISWERLFVPGFNVSTGTMIGYSAPKGVVYNSKPLWPVNVYSVNIAYYNGPFVVYAEPIVLEPLNAIMVIPSSTTAIVNVAYNV